MSYEIAKYDYLTSKLVYPNVELAREETGGSRFYALKFPDGLECQYTSVTSTKNWFPESKYLTRWKEEQYAKHGVKQAKVNLGNTAQLGTLWHDLNSKYAIQFLAGNKEYDFEQMNKDIDLYIKKNNVTQDTSNWKTMLKKDMQSTVKLFSERIIEVIAVEIVLYSHQLQLVGTCDLIAKINWQGKECFAIIDYKSSRPKKYNGVYQSRKAYDSQYQQLKLYGMMFNEVFKQQFKQAKNIDWLYFNVFPEEYKKTVKYNMFWHDENSICDEGVYTKGYDFYNYVLPIILHKSKQNSVVKKSLV